MGRTCGEPDEIKKNTHPKNFTALFREQAWWSGHENANADADADAGRGFSVNLIQSDTSTVVCAADVAKSGVLGDYTYARAECAALIPVRGGEVLRIQLAGQGQKKER